MPPIVVRSREVLRSNYFLSLSGRTLEELLPSSSNRVLYKEISNALEEEGRLFSLSASLGFHDPPLFTFKTDRLDLIFGHSSTKRCTNVTSVYILQLLV